MRPITGEYISYYDKYINLVAENDIVSALQNNHQSILAFIKSIPTEKADFKYAFNKWSVKQVINHIIDTERIFSYRALRFSRSDAQLLPGFEENHFAAHANLSTTDLNLLAEEFDAVRKATILQFKQLSDKELILRGMTGAGEVNVISIGFTICGHAQHHINVIKQKYLQTT